ADYLESFLASAFGEIGEDGDLLLSADDAKAEDDDEEPRTVARYPVVGTIGRGGIGVVYRAEDEELGRELAVKVLRRSLARHEELRRRFVEEARICSRLQHPGVVPVHEVGTLDDGRPYFTMKIVEGKTLAERLATRTPDRDDARRDLEVFSKIGQTLAYAHSHGVVHGDVKPQNVMVGAFGEVQLMDWGFARGPESPVETPAGEPRTRVIGTPAYMAPEQAKGTVTELTPRTDVFGLGAILCEILSGAPPYLADSKSEVCAIAARADLGDARARLEACGEDEALVALALRCMAADPLDRPVDAGAVAAEVDRHLDGLEQKARSLEVEAAEARAVAAEERRSRRLTLALTLTVLVALVASAAILLWIERDRSRRRAAIERGIATAEERASLLRRDALTAPPGEAGAWDGVLAAALEATRLARSPDAAEESAARVSALTRALEEEARTARKDADVLRRLADLRPHVGDDRSNEELDRAYADIFADVGIAFGAGGTLDVAAAAATLRTSSVRGALIDALDEWVHHRRRLEGEDGGEWRTLLALADAADDDPWRREMRDGYARADVDLLRTLAEANVTRHVSPVALDLLARALLERGGRDAAIDLYRRAARLHPGDFWIHHNLAGQLHSLRPRPAEEILRHLHMALAIRPDSAHARTDLALEHLMQGRDDDAIEILEQARRLDPRYGRAAFLLGAAYVRNERLFDALLAARDAEQLDIGGAWTTLVQAQVGTGHLEEAYDRLERRRAEAPDDPIVPAILAAILTDDYRYEEALEQADRALELEPANANAYGVRMMIRMERGDFEGALAALATGREIGERGPDPLSDVYRQWIPRLREFQEIVPFVERVKRGEPAPAAPGARLAMAEVAFLIGEADVALELLESALPDPGDPSPWSSWFLAARAAARAGAEVERTLGHVRRAVEECEAAVERGDVSPRHTLPMLRKWRLSPELVGLAEGEPDAAALAARIDALARGVREDGLRAARERAVARAGG
ncbi:MAG: protein kinase, partial [Planctomycetota bacterium JB042]